MRRTLGMLAVGLAALACALPLAADPTEGPAINTTAPATTAATAAPTEPPPPATEAAPVEPTTAVAASVNSLPNPDSANWQPILTNLDQPLGLENVGDGRLFIVEQSGLIGIYQQGELSSEPFLDIRDRVLDAAFEQGLLGLAFHPDFTNNGLFFVNYTDQNGNTRISRFSLSDNPNLADPDTEQVILSYEQPFANHNGGGLAFGPDGYLYIAAGDGGSAGDPQGNGQSLNTLLGKLLRVDINAEAGYLIPDDNPFVDQDNALDEIWAYGLRNPWRFSFDPQSGDLFIADVGQNQWEEVNYEPAESDGGLNYGWDLWEGTHAFEGGGEGTVMPVAEYGHQFGCSVTGGVVVRNQSLPDWNGVYVYGDYCSGNIWGLVQNQDGQWQNELLYQTEFRPSAFGTDSAGEVYLVDHNGGLYHLTPTN